MNPSKRKHYRGRFAPSPSGPLHFGSLVTAMGSYLDALANEGKWLVRIEDLDPPREMKGAARDILLTLEAYGFEWDGEVLYQSQRRVAYDEAFSSLKKRQKTYGCTCTRREINGLDIQGLEGTRYPGTCRSGPVAGRKIRTQRIVTDNGPVGFRDRIYGDYTQRLAEDIGDFVLIRAEGLFAYQLAVVVDDECQGITNIVRGADLLISTPRQIYLQTLLNYQTPVYAHLPLVLDPEGNKLSKQMGSHKLETSNPLPPLVAALEFLMGPSVVSGVLESVTDFWRYALERWDLDAMQKMRSTTE